MRTRTLRLPENLALDDVADVARRLGMPLDRTNVARALRDVVIRGVREPETPRGRWRIPRVRLHECVGAVLLRREARKPGWRNLDPEAFVWLAAESMLGDPELEGFVPRRLKAEILEELRLEEERRERAERRARAERKAAERRARELEERRAFNEVRQECYWRCRQSYLFRFWREFPPGEAARTVEGETFDREWPRKMPSWWMPPPAFFEAMKDFLRRRGETRNFNLEAPEHDQWLPRFELNKPWPWRRSEPDGDGATG
jgi:hypothetical protein